MSHVISVAPALPGPPRPQAEITAAIAPLLAPDATARALLEKVHRNSGVTTRHLALEPAAYADLGDFGATNDLFRTLGTDLAERAAADALASAGIAADEVDFVLFTSVTGISAPSVDALLVGRLGLRPDVRRLPSFGLGCVAGAAGLARVHDYLAGHPGDVALLVCLELCSLTVQRGDRSPANMVASGLFGDGAAAAVVVGDAHPATARAGQGPEVVATRSRLYPGTEDVLGWDVRAEGFRIVLSPTLPALIEESLGQDAEALLSAHGLKPGDVTTWVVHAGGPRILDAVQVALGLDDDALEASRASLASVGNLSSASVLDVLHRILRRPVAPEPGSPGMVVAFGPGVSAELVLLRWPEAAAC
ncbi:type III polyketide synthase [Actinotalea sp. Marseille-Q4924]|uniref:type III polyketide synthase n=1 Tax=Actinotalea sp. Marseille-Q4924 TaxID=2866571 RepID=UPI001CE4076F|nr:3-oxoacyl-[acyl-carrier-protein] synthase III C-terminal domain-containing protein [Actinotalea sp. Marseille-Q4924]